LPYLIQLDVDVIGNITAKLCEVWSKFNIFCTLITMATTAILIFFNPQNLPHTTVDIPTKIRVDLFKMAAVAMETAKMLNKIKNPKKIIAGYSPNRN
jgi:hypothetical protein